MLLVFFTAHTKWSKGTVNAHWDKKTIFFTASNYNQINQS